MQCPECHAQITCSRSDRIWSIVNYIALALLFVICLPSCFWLIHSRQRFMEVFSNMGVELPLPTVVFLSIPSAVWLALGIVVSIFLVVKEFLIKPYYSRLAINSLVLFIVALTHLFIIFSLYLPLLKTQAWVWIHQRIKRMHTGFLLSDNTGERPLAEWCQSGRMKSVVQGAKAGYSKRYRKKEQMIRKLTICVLLGLASGCNPNSAVQRDLSKFLQDEFASRIPEFKPVKPLTPLMAAWTVEKDEYGFQLHIKDSTFETVTIMLNECLGTPTTSSININGRRQWRYFSKEKRVHLQVLDDTAEVFIVCIVGKHEKR